jgi:hypothetical protein
VPLCRNHARPRCTVRVQPAATRGTACVRGAGAWPSSAGPRNTWRTAGARGGGAARRRLCSVSRRQQGADARGTARNERLTGAAASGEAVGAGLQATRRRTAAVGTRAVRVAARLGWRRDVRGGRASGQRCEGDDLKLRATARRVAAARARRGARRLTGGARSSVISELKINQMKITQNK